MESTANPQELLGRFWSELKSVSTGLLGLPGDKGGHAQPMTAHFDGAKGPIYFFARTDGDLAQSTDSASAAVFHYAGDGHDLYACVHGDLSVVDEPKTVAKFWNEEVARWFDGGQDDPNLALLRFDLEKAHIWLPKDNQNTSTFGFGGDKPKDVRAEARL